MSALLTALRGTGRDAALVQRPRRRMHVATIASGDTTWIALCGRDVPAAGASFWMHDAAEHADEHVDEMCKDCAAITRLAAWLADRLTAPTSLRSAAR